MTDTAGSPPPWAGFFSPQAWAHFVVTVTQDLTTRGLAHDLHADEGFVVVGPEKLQLGLMNLAQMCHAAAIDRWPGIVNHHFGVGLEPDDTTEIGKDFQRARELMKIRLWGRNDIPPTLTPCAWDIADDLVAVLTYDMPRTLVSASSDDVSTWGVAREELYRIALGNVRAEGALEVSRIEIGSAHVFVLEGDRTFFAASHLLFLEDYAEARSPHGAVVAVPRRHVVVFHPIVDLSVVHAINSMLHVVPHMWDEGPGSITPSLYWWQPGPRLVRLPVEYGEESTAFMPPPEFVDVLNRLPPERR